MSIKLIFVFAFITTTALLQADARSWGNTFRDACTSGKNYAEKGLEKGKSLVAGTYEKGKELAGWGYNSTKCAAKKVKDKVSKDGLWNSVQYGVKSGAKKAKNLGKGALSAVKNVFKDRE